MQNCELSVDLTYNCHYSCPFCSSPYNVYLPDMTLDIADKCSVFIDGLPSSKTEQIEVTITGGEPLTSTKLPLFVSKWSEHGYKVNLCTTAALDMGKAYWKNLFLSGLQSVRVSLHSISPEGSQTIFGRKYLFAIVAKNIEQIRNAGITLNANYLLSRLNANSFDDVQNYCFLNGIKTIRVLGLTRQGRAVGNWESLCLASEKQASIIEHIGNLLNHGPDLEFAGLPNHKWCTHTDRNGNCLGGTSFFHVNTNGDIYACPSVKAIPSQRIGSVLSPAGVTERKTLQPCLQKDSQPQVKKLSAEWKREGVTPK